MNKHLNILIIIAVLISGCSIFQADSERVDTKRQIPDAEQAEDNKTLKPVSAQPFHENCAQILKSFVDDNGMVNYTMLREENHSLRELLDKFGNLNPNEFENWSIEDKTAFWINAYNLNKLYVVSANYPIQSPSRFLNALWDSQDLRHIEEKITGHKFLIMAEEFTFKKIENVLSSKQFNDPRVFLALTDACISSPPLNNEPYYGYKLAEQLETQTKKFLSSPLAFRIETQQQIVYLSAFFDANRFGKQFLDKFATETKFKGHSSETRAVLNFISNYISEQDISFLEIGNYSVKYMTYDWKINDGS